jgi:hypothetical protein
VTIGGSCAKADVYVIIDIYVKCFPPEYATLSTSCWSIGVWNNARAGDTDDAINQMYWFPEDPPDPPDELAFMFDEGVVITYADDTALTYTSVFDGSDFGLTLVPEGPLTTASFPTYEYAQALWSVSDQEFGPGDPPVAGEIEYFVPIHPDTCVLVERIKVCNNVDTTIRIHVGEAIDWDIPSTDGENNNDCGADDVAQIVYQMGTDLPPETDYYGSVQFCNYIPGAIVVDNESYVYPQSGYNPEELGGFLNSLGDYPPGDDEFIADCPDPVDYSSIYVAGRNVVLDPEECVVYCKVKTSTGDGLADLEDLLFKGRWWIASNQIDCPGGHACCCVKVGDADGSGSYDIDDVVYLISFVFSGGPAPVPCELSSGDANSSYGTDIDDVVFLINHIFLSGPLPDNCLNWVTGFSY